MRIRIQLAKIKQTKWHEYAVRFAFGGVITAFAGWLGEKFGPDIGELFLAFPAILPASLTLVQQHEGKSAAWVDTIGAAIGSLGLVGFAIVVWVLSARIAAWQVLLLASLVWVIISGVIWLVRQRPRVG